MFSDAVFAATADEGWTEGVTAHVFGVIIILVLLAWLRGAGFNVCGLVDVKELEPMGKSWGDGLLGCEPVRYKFLREALMVPGLSLCSRLSAIVDAACSPAGPGVEVLRWWPF